MLHRQFLPFAIMLLSGFLLHSFPSRAVSINVSGEITSSVTWSGDTVYVDGHILVQNGVILEIDTGVKVVFTGHYTLAVRGAIKATGASGDSIYFTVSDTSGYDTLGHAGWWGIRFLAPYSTNDTSVFSHCVFEYGKADSVGDWRYGGAFYINDYSRVEVRSSVIRHCSATLGGAVYLTNDANPVFRDVAFLHNHADYGGGAYICEASSPQFIRSTFRGNSSNSGGGALAVYSQSEPLIQGSIIAGNVSAVNGAGLYISFESIPRIYNTTIAFNEAGGYGGGLFMQTNADPQIINSIIWGNTAGKGSPSLYLLDCSTEPEISWSNIEGDTTEAEGVGILTYPDSLYFNNMNVDPAFVDAPGDLRLQVISPLINGGRPDTSGLFLDSLDILGNDRLMYDTVDIGASEFTIPLNLPEANLYSPATTFCRDHVPVKLSGYPSGGTYSGTGMAAGVFYPAFAGTGSHLITYEVDPTLAYPNIDSIWIQVVSIPAVSHADTSACSGQFSIILSGGQPAGGTYSGAHVNGNVFHVLGAGIGVHQVEYHYQNPHGCESSHIFTVSVSHPQQPIIDPVPQQCEYSVPWNLSGIPAGGTFSGDWVQNGQFHADSAAAGDYTIHYTFENSLGCQTSDSIVVSVAGRPSAGAGQDDTICEGSCVSLNGSGGSSYHWSTGQYGQSVQVCPSQDELFTLTVTDTNGCTAMDSVRISVEDLPLADAGAGDTTCPGDTVQLLAADAGPMADYSWSDGSSGRNITVHPLLSTQYTLTVSSAFGCSATDQVGVLVLPGPQVTITPDTSICEDQCAQLTATGGTGYNWTGGHQSSTINVCPGTSTAYTVTVSGNTGCDAVHTVMVSVLPRPATNYPADTFVCHGACIIFPAYAQVSANPIWLSPKKVVVINKYCPEDDTSYIFTTTAQNGCKTVDTVMVDVLPELGAGITSMDTAQPGDTLSLAATQINGNPPFTYEWWPTERLLDSTSSIVDYVPLVDGKIFVKVTDSLGCSDVGYKWIEVENPLGSIAGKLFYANSQQTAMKNVGIVLEEMSGNKVVAVQDTVWTDVQGYFWLNEVDTGHYRLTPLLEGNLPWGGVNATDALLSLRQFVGLENFQGVYLKAGDVTGESTVNATDGLNMSQRFVGNLSGFQTGDWVDDPVGVRVSYPDSMDHWFDIQTLARGDINASHVPFLKAGPKLVALEKGVLTHIDSGPLEVPFTTRVGDLAAYSIVLRPGSDALLNFLEVEGPDHGHMESSIRDGSIRLAWYSGHAINPLEGRPIFTLKWPAYACPEDISFTVEENSELADHSGGVYPNGVIHYPKLLDKKGFGSGVTVYPNPGSGMLNIRWTEGTFQPDRVDVHNALGQTLGSYSMKSNGGNVQVIDIGQLPSGLYFLCIYDEESFIKQLRYLHLGLD